VTVARRRRWFFLALLVCVAVFVHRSRQIEATLPYPQSGDERPLAQAALRILQSGDLNPHFFRYPSLPIYGATVGLAGGVAYSVATGEIEGVKNVRRVRTPSYSHPTVMKAARQLFLLIALCGLVWCGIAAAQLAKQPLLRVLAPCVLLLTPLYGLNSWWSLNVDIWAAVATLGALAWLASSFRSRGFVAKALVPGLLAGAAAASKYNAGMVVLPCVLSIWLFEGPEKRLVRAAQLAAVSAAAFVAFCPYSLLSPGEFMDGVLYEVRHYATGHKGVAYTPGAHFLRNLLVLWNQFGAGLLAASVCGLVVAFRLDWRRATVLASSFVATVAFMSTQKVHFPRNLLPAIAGLAIFAAWGLVVLASALRRGIEKYVAHPRLAQGVSVVVVALIAIVPIDSKSLASNWAVRVDSRNEAINWLNRNGPRKATVLVDRALDLDARSLRHGLKLRVIAPKALPDAQRAPSREPRFLVLRGKGKGAREASRAASGATSQVSLGTGKAEWPVVNPRLTIYSANAPDRRH
jgi:hypothetical protein